jgi:hypothetical protein
MTGIHSHVCLVSVSYFIMFSSKYSCVASTPNATPPNFANRIPTTIVSFVCVSFERRGRAGGREGNATRNAIQQRGGLRHGLNVCHRSSQYTLLVQAHNCSCPCVGARRIGGISLQRGFQGAAGGKAVEQAIQGRKEGPQNLPLAPGVQGRGSQRGIGLQLLQLCRRGTLNAQVLQHGTRNRCGDGQGDLKRRGGVSVKQRWDTPRDVR